MLAVMADALAAYAVNAPAPGDRMTGLTIEICAAQDALYDALDAAGLDPDACFGCGWVDGVVPASPAGCPLGDACRAVSAMRLAYPDGRPA